MARRLPHGPRAHVGLLVAEVGAPPGHSVVLDPEVLPLPVGEEVLEVFHRELPAHVLVELPVVEVARVARLRAPDLAGGLHVAAEEDDPARRDDRGVDTEARARVGVREAVRLEEAEAEAGLLEEDVVARQVAALGQPDPVGRAAEVLAVVRGGDLHLGAHRLRHRVHERKEAVGRAAGDDLEIPGIPVLAERAHQVRAVDLAEDPPDVRELVQVEPGEVVELGLPPLRPVHLAPRQLDEVVEVPVVAPHQELVRHHRDERRRERHGQPVLDAVVQQAVEDAEDRDVGLGERLEEPVLLEKGGVLRVPDVGQVGVEDGTPVPGGHRGFPTAGRCRWRPRDGRRRSPRRAPPGPSARARRARPSRRPTRPPRAPGTGRPPSPPARPPRRRTGGRSRASR